MRRIDKPVLNLAYSMVETMKDANGVGLAANQVGELRRVIVIQLPEEDEVRIYINPEILQFFMRYEFASTVVSEIFFNTINSLFSNLAWRIG